MNTIPDDIAAMVDALVRMELVRVAPAEPCRICRDGDPCAWHRTQTTSVTTTGNRS